MSDQRDPITLTLLPDGKVLVTGGFIGFGGTIPELFDPATGTWTAVGESVRPAPIGDAAVGWHDANERLFRCRAVRPGHGGLDPHRAAHARVARNAGGSCCSTAPSSRQEGGLSGGGVCRNGRGGAVRPSRRVAASAAGVPEPTAASRSRARPRPRHRIPPQAGPVPPNARPWKVKVVNKSSQPATLFVAEEDERGPMARLVGSVTPNVVPPGATVQVTFLLPAKGVDGWSICVNPGPDHGGLLGWTDVALGGEIHILDSGQPAWLPVRSSCTVQVTRSRRRRLARHRRLYDRATVRGRSASPSMAAPSWLRQMAPTPTTSPPSPAASAGCRPFTMARSPPAPTGWGSGTRTAASASRVAAHRPRTTQSE